MKWLSTKLNLVSLLTLLSSAETNMRLEQLEYRAVTNDCLRYQRIYYFDLIFSVYLYYHIQKSII